MTIFRRLVVCKEMVKRGERRNSANKRFALGSRREEPRSISEVLLIYVSSLSTELLQKDVTPAACFRRGLPGSSEVILRNMPEMSNDPVKIAQRLSADRLGSYLDATDGNLRQALDLYKWNIALSGALFEAIAVVEVVVRNEIDNNLQT